MGRSVENDQGDGAMTKPPHLSTKQESYNYDHGTPGWILNIVRREFPFEVLIDLASSQEHNHRIWANHFFSEENPCPYEFEMISGLSFLPVTKWLVFCNPPDPAYSVHWFFDVWLNCINQGADGAFLFFNVDQMRRVEPMTYRELTVLLFHDRVRYIGNRGGASFPSALVLTGPLQNDYSDIAQVFEWKNW